MKNFLFLDTEIYEEERRKDMNKKFTDFKNFLSNKCIMFGSRRFGYEDKNSDFDYVTDIKNKEELIIILEQTKNLEFEIVPEYKNCFENNLPLHNLFLVKIILKNDQNVEYKIEVLFYETRELKTFHRINEIFSMLIQDNRDYYAIKKNRIFAYNKILEIAFKEVKNEDQEKSNFCI